MTEDPERDSAIGGGLLAEEMGPGSALAHRLRRVYLPMFAIPVAAWVVRVTAFAGSAWPESAAIGRIPGLAVSAAARGSSWRSPASRPAPARGRGNCWTRSRTPGTATREAETIEIIVFDSNIME